MGETDKKAEMLPSDVQAIEARLKLNVYEHLDERVTKEFRSIMWRGAVLVGVCSAVIGILGYSHISAFLSERLDKQVDVYFAAHGAARLEENLAQAGSLIEQSKRMLATLKEQEQELSDMKALKRLRSVEGELAKAQNMLRAATSGTVFAAKGRDFQLVVGPKVETFRVRDIQMDKEKIEVLLTGGAFGTQKVKASYLLNSNGLPVFGKEVSKLRCDILFDFVEARVVFGDKSGVMLAMDVRHRVLPWDDLAPDEVLDKEK